MEQSPPAREALDQLKKKVRQVTEFNVTSVRDIALHFQALKSARAHRLLMDAPGIYYRDAGFYVVSKSGASRGHATIHNAIAPLLPEDRRTAIAFVLYPESYVRSCLDKILRKSVRSVSPEMRLSMENNFNSKYHHGEEFTDSPVMEELIVLMRQDL